MCPSTGKRPRLESSSSSSSSGDPSEVTIKRGKRSRQDNVTASQIFSSHETSATAIPILQSRVVPAAVGVGGKINCLNALYFHPVRTESDYFQPSICFSPLFVHHFFGLKEEIHGFSELLIRIFYTVDTFEVFVKVEGTRLAVSTSTSSLVSPSVETNSCVSESTIRPNEEESQALPGAKIFSYLCKVPYPGDFHRTEASFLEAIRSPSRARFKPPGNFMGQLSGTPEDVAIQLFHCGFDDKTVGGQEFSQYHRRIEWFLHFFIDGCSNIDHDHHWIVLLPYAYTPPGTHPRLHRTLRAADENGEVGIASGGRGGLSAGTPKRSASRSRPKTSLCPVPSDDPYWSGYELVGLVTTYHFYALPSCRRRVSQFLIFPYFQGRNIGLRLLEWVFQNAIGNPEVGEITVEDPARSFGQLRHIVGLTIALKNGAVKAEDFFPDGTFLVKKETGRGTSPKALKREAHVEDKENGTPARAQRKKSLANVKGVKATVRKSGTATATTPASSAAVGFIGDVEFKRRLKAATKESPNQIVHLIEIISMAKAFPHPLPPPPMSLTVPAALSDTASTTSSQNGQSHVPGSYNGLLPLPSLRDGPVNGTKIDMSRDWRHLSLALGDVQQELNSHPPIKVGVTNTLMGSNGVDFHISEEMKEIRIKIKKRIRLDHLEELGSLTPNEQKLFLASTWNELYMSYYRTVRKIRDAILG